MLDVFPSSISPHFLAFLLFHPLPHRDSFSIISCLLMLPRKELQSRFLSPFLLIPQCTHMSFSVTTASCSSSVHPLGGLCVLPWSFSLIHSLTFSPYNLHIHAQTEPNPTAQLLLFPLHSLDNIHKFELKSGFFWFRILQIFYSTILLGLQSLF